MLQMQAAALGLATPTNIYNSLAEMTKNAGFKDVSRFWTDPSQTGYQPPPNPLAMSDREQLPPEPRLQMAPGFGVDTEKGRVNLELSYPQSEYRTLHADKRGCDARRDKKIVGYV